MKKRQPALARIVSDAPLYKEVRRRILDAVARGEWRPGERLPNETELAAQLGVAVSTVRAGVGALTRAGVLVRLQGKGTFVARHDFERQQFRFSNIYDGANNKVLTSRKVTAMKKGVADREAVRLLQIRSQDPVQVHHVSATLKAGGSTVAVMELILPVARFPTLKQKDLEQTSENLYTVYQRVSGVTVLRMEERIRAAVATPGLARALKVSPGHPVLCVERVAFTFNDEPVEIRRRFYEGNAHHYLFLHDRLD